MPEKPNLGGELNFTPEQIQEITGIEKVESLDQVKELFETLKNKEPEKVTESYKFKDEYIEKAVTHYNEHGELAPFVQSNVDYGNHTPEQLIALEVRAQNAKLSEKAQAILVKKELAKYDLGDDATDDDKELQGEIMNQRADDYRQALTKKQEEFNAPKKPSVDFEDWTKTVGMDSSTQTLNKDKMIKFSYDEEEFNMEIKDPQKIVDMTIDNSGFFKLFTKEDGAMDLSKWYKMVAYAQNPAAYEALLIKHGKSIGTENVVTDLKNTELERNNLQGANAGDLLTAFAEKGRKTVSRR